MKFHAPQRRKMMKSLEILLLPTVILLGIYFHLSQAFIVPLVVVLALLLGAVLLWSKANADASGNEWWQDDDASGWRGYF